MKTVYLCGAINGMSDEEATSWRKTAVYDLRGQYTILDPMTRDYRGKEAENVEAIVHGDLEDINNSDVLLVRADRPSWGTAMEVFYAHQQSKRVVVFGVDPERLSPWLRYHSTEVFQTLPEALSHLKQLT